MSQPTPRQNFFQTLLLFTVIFLGMQLMCNRPHVPETRTADEIYQSLQKMNAEVAAAPATKGDIATHAIVEEAGKYFEKLNALEMSEEEKAAQKLRAEVLVADTQFKFGQANNDFNVVTMAYQRLHKERFRLGETQAWRVEVPVTASEKYPDTALSANDLHELLHREASRIGKTTLVWGFFPGYQMIDALVNLTGAVPAISYAFAALLLAIAVRGIVWPLAQRQYMWSRQMSQLQPLVKELKDKYQGQELNMKIMELYKEYGINPMAGCGPALLQMPLFILVYQCMLFYKFEFQKGVFLWINPNTSAATNGLVAPNLGEIDYILLVLYGASMIVTTMITPVSDPANAKQQRLMGIGIAVFFTAIMFLGIFPVPAAFVLYWIFTNILATLQSLRAYRLPLPPLVKVNTKEGGVYPVEARNGKTNGKPEPVKSDAFKHTGAPKLHKPKKKRK